MKVESKHVINDKVCEKVGKISGLEVYEYYSQSENQVTLYFSKDGEVQKAIKVYADCAQNSAFIDSVNLINKDNLS